MVGLGVAAIAFGAPVHTSALGQTSITAGTTALVGGLLLVGLATAVAKLSAIMKVLMGKSVVQPARASDVRQAAEVHRRVEVQSSEPRAPELRASGPHAHVLRAPELRPAEPESSAAIHVSTSAIERLRTSVLRAERVVANAEDVPLSPNGSHQPAGEPALELKPSPVTKSGSAIEGLREPRLDFLFRSKGPQSLQQDSFDAMWPKRRGSIEQPKSDEVVRQSGPAAPVAPLMSEREPRSVAILKSGVVDGMAYTLYADGSIEAQLSHGTVRFGSIAELRAHIENNF